MNLVIHFANIQFHKDLLDMKDQADQGPFSPGSSNQRVNIWLLTFITSVSEEPFLPLLQSSQPLNGTETTERRSEILRSCCSAYGADVLLGQSNVLSLGWIDIVLPRWNLAGFDLLDMMQTIY